MSQKKVDMRKKSKGDMIHSMKKQMQVTITVVAVVLVAIGALAAVITYSRGYDKGVSDGKIEGYSEYQAYQEYLDALAQISATTTAGEGETTKAGETATTEEDTQETTTAAEDETTTEESTAASEE